MNKPAFSSFSVIVVFIALMIIGTAFIPRLDIRYKQSRNLPQLNVRFAWANASPKVIEQETAKIEGVLGKVSQIESIESTSSVGSGNVILKFDKTADLNQKRYEVSTLIRQLRSNLPANMSYPEITTNIEQEDDQVSFMVLTLNANSSTHYIKNKAEQLVIPELLKIEGIADITLYGATPNQWEICYDPQLLKNFEITPAEISAVINRLGDLTFLGNQNDVGGGLVPVLSSTQYIDPINWGTLPISNKNGRIVQLSDVATIKLKEKPPTSYFRINGKNTLNLVVYAAQGENQVKLANKIREQLGSIQKKLPSGYQVQVATDSTEFIKEELTKIGLRTMFSLLILLLFVLIVSRSFRVLAVLFISLVANLLIAAVFYYLFEVEIHIYSLAGITVSFGIIIDNSIIMVSHLQRQKGLRVFISLLAATLTTLGALSVALTTLGALSVVFFLKDKQKVLLIDFTYVMLINLSVSLVVALFLVPALMEHIYLKKEKPISRKTLRRINKANGVYYRFICFEKRFRWAFFVLAILGFGLPISSLPDEIEISDEPTRWETKFASAYNKTLGADGFKANVKPILEKSLGGALRLFTEHVFEGSFYADPGRTTLYVRGRMPEGCTIHQLNEAVRKMEQYISQFDEVAQFETRITDYKNSAITIQFAGEAEKSSFPFLLKSQVESKAISLGGMDWSVYGVGKGFSNALNLDYKNSHILLTGYNYDQLFIYAEQLEAKLLENPRVEKTEITSSQGWRSNTRYEYNLQVDKNLLASYDLKYSDYTGSLFTQLYSRNLKPFYNQSELQPVVLVSSVNQEYNKWDFYNIPVQTSQGQKKLSQAGSIEKELTGKSIYKKNQVYQVYLNYNFIGPAPLSKMVQEREIEAINQVLPLGYKAQKPENYWNWNRKDKKQYYLLLLIIVIIFFITAILFESLLKPLAVISLIPISFIGVFLTFYFFDFNFDQGGFASFILLSGLVVNAAIYIINDFNNLISRKDKAYTIRTYLKAFNQKIVAITLTILSTVLGLIPFIWGGQKEVFWFAFAVGAMGGLIFSLVAIVVYLPLFLKLQIYKKKN
jgi:multidrug efflux pump subunit AcrB